MRIAVAAACAYLVWALPCPADELKLKDGTKITGTIVGYEKDSFRVETSYGFALVRKDKVESIVVTDAPKKNDEAKAKEGQQTPPAAPPPTVAALPTPAPTEPAIRESVDGTAYTNHTFRFRLYKPPSWRVIEGARKLLPAAIVAMGTNDQSTLLVMGRLSQQAPLDAQLATMERELRTIYQNYTPARPERTIIAGQPAMQRRFRGMADEREWSGMIIVLSHGNDAFTILGMTHSETDLVQIQENVIARTVSSLEFIQ